VHLREYSPVTHCKPTYMYTARHGNYSLQRECAMVLRDGKTSGHYLEYFVRYGTFNLVRKSFVNRKLSKNPTILLHISSYKT